MREPVLKAGRQLNHALVGTKAACSTAFPVSRDFSATPLDQDTQWVGGDQNLLAIFPSLDLWAPGGEVELAPAPP